MFSPSSENSRNRLPVFALLGANAVSYVGNVVSVVALPWFVLQTTGSAAQTGITGAALVAGVILSGVFGGPMVDRMGFKQMSVASDLVSAVTVGLVPLLYLTVGLEFWQLIGLVFLGAVLDTPGGAARSAMIPELAREARMPLERANSAIAAIPRLAQFVGPPLAGVLVVIFGAGNVLWVNAASFVVSALLVAILIPGVSKEEDTEQTEARSGYFYELREGFRFVRGKGVILSMLFMCTVANMLDDPLIIVILPAYADSVYGSAAALGGILGAFGGGAVAGTLLFGAFGNRLPRRRTFIVSFTSVPVLLYLVLAASPPLPVLLASFVIGGIACGSINPIIDTVIQENVPKEMRGRVFGVIAAIALAGAPVGLVSGGFLVDRFGIFPTILGMGLCYLAATLSMYFNPTLKAMEKPERTTL